MQFVQRSRSATQWSFLNPAPPEASVNRTRLSVENLAVETFEPLPASEAEPLANQGTCSGLPCTPCCIEPTCNC